MKQAQLIIIADHNLDFKDKERIISLCLTMDLKALLQDALNVQANLENYKDPETAEKIEYKDTDLNGDIHFTCNQIKIRISKHLIYLYFPFIFRVIVDYSALRQAYYVFLHTFLSSFYSTEIITLPSFWVYEEYEIRNDWHRRRLYELQHKIVHEGTSFKRCKLNLIHCLGNPESDVKTIMAKKYRVWISIPYKDLV